MEKIAMVGMPTMSRARGQSNHCISEFGSSPFFHLRHNHDREKRYKILLEHGSLLLMGGETQHFWKHQVSKTVKKINPRINLTFRKINHSN